MKKFILTLFFITLFFSCSDEIDELFQMNTSLTIVNNKPDTSVKTISFGTYQWDGLDITNGISKTFVLDNTNIYSNIKITISYVCNESELTKDIQSGFTDNQNTTITISSLGEGCDQVKLE